MQKEREATALGMGRTALEGAREAALLTLARVSQANAHAAQQERATWRPRNAFITHEMHGASVLSKRGELWPRVEREQQGGRMT